MSSLSGILFIVAAVTFVLGWMLMPVGGTADPVHILKAVSGRRSMVWWSVVVHIVSGLAFTAAVAGVQADPRANQSRLAQIGAWLVIVEPIGVCMDALFHLVAYYLTADGVRPVAVLEPMRLLQTKGLAFLVPLLVALIVGGVVCAVGLWRADVTTARPWQIITGGIVVGVIGGALAATGPAAWRRPLVLTFLVLLALGYRWIGLDLVTGRRRSA